MNLKQIVFFIALTALPLFAGISITDGELKAEFDKDVVKIYCQKGQKLAMTLRTEPAIQNAYAETVNFPKKQNVLLIRGDNGSFAVMLTEKTVQIPSSNGIQKLNMTVKTEAVILPDSLAEDEIIQPQEKPLRIPNFLNCFRILANDQELILNCISSARPSDVTFRKVNGETQFSFPQGNGENMIFTFLTGKGVWAKFNGVTTAFKDIDWKPPFSACYVVSFKRSGQSRMTYPMYVLNNMPYNYRSGAVHVTISGLYKQDPPTMWHSHSDFVAYPFAMNNNNVQLRLPSGKKIKVEDFSPDNAYIYAFGPFVHGYKDKVSMTPASQVFPVLNPNYHPQKYLAPYARGPLVRNRTFDFPPTCASTNRVEASFVKGTAKKEVADLRNQLNRMDMFQAGIRARLEQYMRWSEDMRPILQTLPNYKKDYEPLLNGFRKHYEYFAPRMKQVHECHALSLKMRKLIDANGDEEKLEEEIKKLGREIRSMGGAQDACLGNMRCQAKKIRAQLLHDYVFGKPDKMLDWKISVIFDDMDRLFNAYISMEG